MKRWSLNHGVINICSQNPTNTLKSEMRTFKSVTEDKVSTNFINYFSNFYSTLSVSYVTQQQQQPINTISRQIFPILKKCTHLPHLKQTHTVIINHGLHHNSQLSSELVALYISFGCLGSAYQVFEKIPHPSSFVWNITLRAYATEGNYQQSLKLYSQMIHTGVIPDKFAFPFALKSCAGLLDIGTGKKLHQHLICCGCGSDVYVGAALVDMYAKCGEVETARRVFDALSGRDMVSWTSMIMGYADNGYNCETLEFFDLMRLFDMKPSRVGLLSVLSACGGLGAVRKGEWFHSYAIQTGFRCDMLVATAILDMYAHCGRLDLAKCMFDETSGKDVVCWSAMIANYGVHGQGRKAIDLFFQMEEAGVKPNHVTLTCVLSACSHSGLLLEGKMIFGLMRKRYKIEPKIKHYACMVDLLGRAGKLAEAETLITNMPVEPDSSLWGSLLSSCRIHGNVKLAKRIANKVFQLNPSHAGYHVLLSNIFAAKSRWDEVVIVRRSMNRKGSQKIQGFSVIEHNNQVYKFGVEDRSHPQSEKIFSLLEELDTPMRQLGYVPHIELFPHVIEDGAK